MESLIDATHILATVLFLIYVFMFSALVLSIVVSFNILNWGKK